MRKFLIISLAFAIVAPAAFQPFASAGAETTISQADRKILETAARSRRLKPGDLTVVRRSTVRLPLIGRTALAAKVLDRTNNDTFPIALDENDNEVDLNGLRQAEETAYTAKYGKLDPSLYDKVQAQRPEERIKVAVWLKLDDDLAQNDVRDGNPDLTEQEVESMIAQREDRLKKAIEVAAERFKADFERSALRVDEVSPTSPIVYVMLPVRDLTTIAQRADVHRIYSAENKYEDYLNVAADTINADVLWNSYGITGSGVNVAIVEDSRVDFDNNCLGINLGTRVPGDGNVDQHATTTAGMVASTNATHRGVANGAGVYSANGTTYSDSNMSAALDAAATNTHIQNNSWGPGCGSADGSMNVHARHADYIVRYRWDTVVAAAGNNGDCAGFEYVAGVGAGYNTIAVGAFDDHGTAGWSDDTMASFSSYLDPTSPHSDRQKPDVAAPGVSISSLLMASPGTCPTGNVGDGTSYASPMVAGVAALLMEARSSLRVYPEAVKALILAGATNNIEGSSNLSEFDGAGGVNASPSYISAVNDRYRWLYMTPSSFDASGYYTINLGTIQAGTRVKAALAWDSNPTSNYSSDPLNADLDLNITGPGFNQWSSSWDNSAEALDFQAPTTGTYTLRIRNWRFDGTNEYVGVAWTLARPFIFPFPFPTPIVIGSSTAPRELQ